MQIECRILTRIKCKEVTESCCWPGQFKRGLAPLAVSFLNRPGMFLMQEGIDVIPFGPLVSTSNSISSSVRRHGS